MFDFYETELCINDSMSFAGPSPQVQDARDRLKMQTLVLHSAVLAVLALAMRRFATGIRTDALPRTAAGG